MLVVRTRWTAVILAAMASCAASGKGATPPSEPVRVAAEPQPSGEPAAREEPPVVREAPNDRCAELHAALAPPDPNVVRVFVIADGSMCVDDVLVSSDAEFVDLCERAARAGATRAIVYADAKVRYGRVVQVMDRLREAGVRELSVGVAGGSEQAR